MPERARKSRVRFDSWRSKMGGPLTSAMTQLKTRTTLVRSAVARLESTPPTPTFASTAVKELLQGTTFRPIGPRIKSTPILPPRSRSERRRRSASNSQLHYSSALRKETGARGRSNRCDCRMGQPPFRGDRVEFLLAFLRAANHPEPKPVNDLLRNNRRHHHKA